MCKQFFLSPRILISQVVPASEEELEDLWAKGQKKHAADFIEKRLAPASLPNNGKQSPNMRPF